MALQNQDSEIFNIIQDESNRQKNDIQMIASENFTSQAVMEAVGSCLMNKYGEGYPGKRYYSGCENVDKIELLCQKRALDLFDINDSEWGVNVQTLSGSVANLCAYGAMLNVGDNISGLHLPSGGHLTHGFETAKKKVSASSKYYNSIPYHLNKSGFIDYDEMESIVEKNNIKLLILGYSAYPRDIDYERCYEIKKKYGCYLMCDMAHFSGLVASKILKSPFEFCDLVTTTTHKTLRGPRGALLFYKKQYEKQINESVFPGHLGGPFFHCIAGIAVALREAKSEEYKNYTKQVVLNMQAFVNELKKYGYKFVTDGSDNHLCLMDCKAFGKTGDEVEKLLQKHNIIVNKNSIVGDISAFKPSGVRIGSAALTTAGYKEDDFILLAKKIHEIIHH
jgi:glycine hydroxymethyltransferase